LNKKSPNKVFGVTKFADMSTTEFRQTTLMPKGKIQKNKNISPQDVAVPKIPASSAPDTFDWREKGAVTAIKDQGQCGSCWAFSVVENVESVYIINGGGKNTTVTLSTQQVVDCDDVDQGCNGGDTPTAFKYIIAAGGLESEDDYPYNANDNDCSFNKNKVQAKISSWKYATTNSDENTMKGNLVSWAPLSICVDAAQWQFYSGGVMTPNDCGDDLDHCVQLIGYNAAATKKYWLVRNSWGDDWGEEGLIRLAMGGDTCGCADEATTAFT